MSLLDRLASLGTLTVREEVEAIARLTCEVYGIPVPRFARFNPRRGWATIRSNGDWMFTLPRWIQAEGQHHVVAYVVHEVAHFAADVLGGDGHDRTFIEAEDWGLREWGLRAVTRFGPERYVGIYGFADPDAPPVPTPGPVFGGRKETDLV